MILKAYRLEKKRLVVNSRFYCPRDTNARYSHYCWLGLRSCSNKASLPWMYFYKSRIAICAIRSCYLCCVSISSLWAFTQAVLQYLNVSRSKGTCPAKFELHHAQLKSKRHKSVKNSKISNINFEWRFDDSFIIFTFVKLESDSREFVV